MKRSVSDWEEAFLRSPAPDGGEVEDGSSSQAVAAAVALEGLLLPRVAQKPSSGGDGGADPFVDVCAYYLGFDFSDPDTIGSYSAGNQIWTQNLTGRHPSISATIESQSSICAESPTSAHKPTGTENQAPGGTSDSDQSDESMEIEQGTNVDLKRMRRMVSNRESARRSRRKKQAHLADLELQVDQLRGDNATLYKQLTDANQQFGNAVTDNRVLKSDVEALRVKVKMAEDLVTRGSLACGLGHLLENHIGSTQLLNARHPYRASEVLPIIEQQADDASYISASVGGQLQNIGMENSEIKNGNIMIRSNQNSPLQSNISMENLQNRVTGEVTGCGTDIWPWDSDANAMSKHI